MRTRPELPEVFLGRDAVIAGALTADQLRGPEVRRLFTGVYCPRTVRDSHELRCRAAALLGEQSLVITGRSAAVLRGVPLARAGDPVEVRTLPGHRVNRRPGLDVRRGPLRPDEHELLGRLRVASPIRTVFDVISTRTLHVAVADLDQLLRAGVVEADALQRALRESHENGVVQARSVLALADARAESPPESVLRTVLAVAGFAPEPQVEIHDHDGFVGRVDLGFRRERLAVEYDGAWHGEQFALTRDRLRLNRLQRAGWEVLTITAPVLRRHDDVVDLVGAALSRRRRHAAA